MDCCVYFSSDGELASHHDSYLILDNFSTHSNQPRLPHSSPPAWSPSVALFLDGRPLLGGLATQTGEFRSTCAGLSRSTEIRSGFPPYSSSNVFVPYSRTLYGPVYGACNVLSVAPLRMNT